MSFLSNNFVNYMKLNNYIRISPIFNNFSLLFFGSLFNQALGLCSLPILTSLYPASSFGQMEVFLSIGGMASVFFCFQFQSLITISRDRFESDNLLLFCFLISAVISLITFFIIYISTFFIIFENFFLIIPMYVFVVSTSEALRNYLFRMENYKSISIFRICKTIFIVLTSLLLFWFSYLDYGLIIGALVGECMGAIMLLCVVSKVFSIQNCSIKITKKIIRENLSLAGTFFASQFFINIILLSPAVFLSFIGSKTEVGYYSVCRQILIAPAMIAENIGSIYRQEALKLSKSKEGFVKCFKTFLLIILVISIPVYLSIILFSDFIISIFVKTNLGEMKSYFIIMLASSLFSFISSPLDKSFEIFRAKRALLLWQSMRFLTILAISIAAYILRFNPINYILFLSLSHMFFYTLCLYISYRLGFKSLR